MRTKLFSPLSACLLFLLPALAQANNTTSLDAYSLMPGATAAEGTLSDAVTERWYKFFAIAGRSYCAETQGGVFFDSGASAGDIDTVITVLRSDGTTVVLTNDQATTEPRASSLSRACWISLFSETTRIRVQRFFSGQAFNFRVRLVETTLFSPWYFLGSDYGAYTVLRNTTSTSVSYIIQWRNAAGFVVGTANGTLAANAGTFVNARDITGVLPANTNGTVEILYNASPGAIVANTTVLSATTGLSFDAPFALRPTW
jgi:hypothetical protein